MGQRANLLIVTGGAYELYYTHHRANTLDHDLFWGPDYALGFIRAQRRLDPPEWLDDVWAEGGAVMDLSRRVLLWFGGEDVMYDVPLRRAHSDLMAYLWAGWTVRWAVGGITDMADHVGRPRTSVLSQRTEPPADPPAASGVVESGEHGEHPEWCNTVATARLASGDVRATRLGGDGHELLYAGPPIAAAVDRADWQPTLALDWTGDNRQTSGFHLDAPGNTVDFWTADPGGAADVQRRVADRWPGWRVTWHGDRFESQLERAGGSLTIRLPGRDALIRRRRESLLRPDDGSGESAADAIVSLARRISSQTDLTVTGINPAALYDARLSVPLAVRTRLFDAAVAATAG